VNEEIEAAKLLADLTKGLIDLFLFGDVARQKQRSGIVSFVKPSTFSFKRSP
jgi:hypothetical protein